MNAPINLFAALPSNRKHNEAVTEHSIRARWEAVERNLKAVELSRKWYLNARLAQFIARHWR